MSTGPDLQSLAVAGKGTRVYVQSAVTATPLTGLTTAGTALTGTGFATDGSWVGQYITISGVQYQIASVTSSSAAVLTSSAGTQTSVTGSISVPTYVPIAELKTFNISGSKNDLEDVTNFDSNGRFKQYLSTLADAGDASMSGNYISTDAGQAAFRAAFNGGNTFAVKVVLPLFPGQTTTPETWYLFGIVQEFDPTISYDKAFQFSAKLKITGPIFIVAGE